MTRIPLTVTAGGGGCTAVVVMPSAFGIGPDLEAQMEELAAAVSVVVALDPFFRGDAGVAAYDDTPRAMRRLASLDRERSERDLLAAIAWTRAQPGVEAVLLLGICFGAPFVMQAAASGVAEGVVTWHGTKIGLGPTAVRCAARHHFGAVDPFVPPEEVEAFRAASAECTNVQLYVHEGATHGFTHRGARQAFHPAAERAAMSSVFELAELLEHRPSLR